MRMKKSGPRDDPVGHVVAQVEVVALEHAVMAESRRPAATVPSGPAAPGGPAGQFSPAKRPAQIGTSAWAAAHQQHARPASEKKQARHGIVRGVPCVKGSRDAGWWRGRTRQSRRWGRCRSGRRRPGPCRSARPPARGRPANKRRWRRCPATGWRPRPGAMAGAVEMHRQRNGTGEGRGARRRTAARRSENSVAGSAMPLLQQFQARASWPG